MTSQLLKKYQDKRDFTKTSEPAGKIGKSAAKLRFVIQLHEATRTHYDFRLEWNGVMKSWAVTKGPSYDPKDKRLAVRTEDHPIAYNSFEGVIPDKQYGAGPVMIWDEGIWEPDLDPEKMEKKGHLTFSLNGTRMKGQWHLVRMQNNEKRENWLLIKGKDDLSLNAEDAKKFLQQEKTSAVSGRTMKEILDGAGLKKKKSIPAEKSSASLQSLIKKYSKPELATLVENPPSGKDWVHEIKYDGYRLLAFISEGKVILQTRGMKDWTHKFTPLADALSRLKLKSAVLDLEACVTDKKGRTDFSMLQKALSEETPEMIEGFVFDLLYLDGKNYSHLSLLQRKQALFSILKKAKAPLHYSEHYDSAPGLLGKACKLGAEGLVSKRKDSIYHGRRTADWLKSKCGLEQEFVIGGFMPSKDNDKAVGAILLGYYKGEKLVYAGKVGTGFTRDTSKNIFKRLLSLKQDTNPFPEKPPRGLRPYIYVRPEILCEVSFAEWTADGHIRHGSFKGLREDKNPRDVKEEKPVKNLQTSKKKKADFIILGTHITHPEREIYPGTGITKQNVAEYYDKVAPLILPFIDNRLISLLRCTDGINGQCFFQRNPMRGMGNRIKSKKLVHKGKKHEYLYITDAEGLMQLIQMGTIELHTWQSRVQAAGKPDQIVFDLDPDDNLPFEAVKLAALDIRSRLKKRYKLESFARLSGGKGIHVVVPIQADHGWDHIKIFARNFAEEMAKEVPQAYVANMSKEKRKGKIFIDFFRNDFSSTAITPFSLRARSGSSIAWPVSWADLKKKETAADYTINNIKQADLKKAAKEIEKFLSLQQKISL